MVLSDRLSGTERFLGRRASARQSHQRELMGPDPVRLFGAVRATGRDAVAANHPGAANPRRAARKWLNKRNSMRRWKRRGRSRYVFFKLEGA